MKVLKLRKGIKRTQIGLPLSTLVLLLSACATAPPVVIDRPVVITLDRSVWCVPAIPNYEGKTNGDLEEYTHALIDELQECARKNLAALAALDKLRSESEIKRGWLTDRVKKLTGELR